MAEQSHREPRTHGPPPNAEAIYQELVDANPFFRLMASLDAVVLDCRRRVTLAPRRCVCAAALLPLIVLACRWFHLAFGTPQRQATLAVCITGQTERLELHSKLTQLISPAAAQFKAVDVALALQPGAARYTPPTRS